MTPKELKEKELEEIRNKLESFIKDASLIKDDEDITLIARSKEIHAELDAIAEAEKRQKNLNDALTDIDKRANEPINPIPVTVQGDGNIPEVRSEGEVENTTIKSAETRERQYQKESSILKRFIQHKNPLEAQREFQNFVDPELRTLGTTSALGAGDVIVPESMAATITELLADLSALRQICLVQVGVRDKTKFPVGVKNTDAAIKAENAAIALTNDDFFTEVVLTQKKITNAVGITTEMMEDHYNEYNLMGFVTRTISESLSQLEEAELMKQARAGITTEVTGATTGDITLADVRKLRRAIATQYRKASVWLASDTALAKIEDFKDNNDRPLYNPTLVDGDRLRLLGGGIYESAAMDAVAANKHALIYGSFGNNAVIGQRRALTMKMKDVPENDGIALYFTLKSGLVITNTAAFAKLKIKA